MDMRRSMTDEETPSNAKKILVGLPAMLSAMDQRVIADFGGGVGL